MTTITLPSSAAARVAQLVRMLGRDQGGEIVAAASAIKRTLAGAGLDLHQLAALTESALVTPPPLAPSHHVDHDLELVIRFCAARSLLLTDRERAFVADLDRLARRLGHRLELSVRQGQWLYSIFQRLRAQ